MSRGSRPSRINAINPLFLFIVSFFFPLDDSPTLREEWKDDASAWTEGWRCEMVYARMRVGCGMCMCALPTSTTQKHNVHLFAQEIFQCFQPNKQTAKHTQDGKKEKKNVRSEQAKYVHESCRCQFPSLHFPSFPISTRRLQSSRQNTLAHNLCSARTCIIVC